VAETGEVYRCEVCSVAEVQLGKSN